MGVDVSKALAPYTDVPQTPLQLLLQPVCQHVRMINLAIFGRVHQNQRRGLAGLLGQLQQRV